MARPMSFDDFESVIRPMIAMYGYVSDDLVSAYWRVLRKFDLADVAWAVDDLLGQEVYESKRPTAGQVKSKAESRQHGDEQGYLECQDHRCESLIPWPTDRTDEGRMYCPRNQPVNGGPEDAATLDEKIEIAKALTPKARAFLRSALPHLMADIPVSLEESEWTETEDKYKLAKERKPASAEVIAESYGANVDDVRRAQHNANTRTLEPL